MAKHTGPGRPRMGKGLRVRVSFTLTPATRRQLTTLARTQHCSRSILVEQALNFFVHNRLMSDARVSDIADATVLSTSEREKLGHLCQAHGIQKLSLFGSVLRPDFGPESDIDVLVEFLPHRTPGLFELASMQEELQDIFGGRHVDLRTYNDLSRYFRDQVLAEAKLVYAA